MNDGLIDDVRAAIREVAVAEIVPRFNALADRDVVEKSPGELATVADTEAERALTRRLHDLLPGVPVVGEEAVAADVAVLDAVGGSRYWVVDPVDGTSNFVEGSPDYATMVALVDGGVTAAAWIYQPATDVMFVAERGAGAHRDGTRLGGGSAAPIGELRGFVKRRYLDDATTALVDRGIPAFAAVDGGRACAGVEYPLLASGEVDFVVYWRTLPWDHLPGVLLAEEAGGAARRFDGSPYAPGDDRRGLLAVADAAAWDDIRGALLGSGGIS